MSTIRPGGGFSDPTIGWIIKTLEEADTSDKIERIIQAVFIEKNMNPRENSDLLEACCRAYLRLRHPLNLSEHNTIKTIENLFTKVCNATPECYNSMLRLYGETKQYAKMEDLLKKAVQNRKTNPETYAIAFHIFREEQGNLPNVSAEDLASLVFQLLWPDQEPDDLNFYRALEKRNIPIEGPLQAAFFHTLMRDSLAKGDFARALNQYQDIPKEIVGIDPVCAELAIQAMDRIGMSSIPSLIQILKIENRQVAEILYRYIRQKYTEEQIYEQTTTYYRNLYTHGGKVYPSLAWIILQVSKEKEPKTAAAMYSRLCHTGILPTPKETNTLLQQCREKNLFYEMLKIFRDLRTSQAGSDEETKRIRQDLECKIIEGQFPGSEIQIRKDLPPLWSLMENDLQTGKPDVVLASYQELPLEYLRHSPLVHLFAIRAAVASGREINKQTVSSILRCPDWQSTQMAICALWESGNASCIPEIYQPYSQDIRAIQNADTLTLHIVFDSLIIHNKELAVALYRNMNAMGKTIDMSMTNRVLQYCKQSKQYELAEQIYRSIQNPGAMNPGTHKIMKEIREPGKSRW